MAAGYSTQNMHHNALPQTVASFPQLPLLLAPLAEGQPLKVDDGPDWAVGDNSQRSVFDNSVHHSWNSESANSCASTIISDERGVTPEALPRFDAEMMPAGASSKVDLQGLNPAPSQSGSHAMNRPEQVRPEECGSIVKASASHLILDAVLFVAGASTAA